MGGPQRFVEERSENPAFQVVLFGGARSNKGHKW